MATVFKINGTAVDLPRAAWLRRWVCHNRRGTPSLTFSVRGKVPPTPDPYLGKVATLLYNGTLYFTGDVVNRHPEWVPGKAWVTTYTALGIRARGDKVRHVDKNNLSGLSYYNLQADNQNLDYLASRAGRTVGQILTDVLTGAANATGLSSYGIGNYTGLPTAPALPSATVTDLAALTLKPPAPVSIGGEKLLSAVEAFCAQWAPNVYFWVQADGTLRFTDLRAGTPHTVTWGSDRVRLSGISRELDGCFPRVAVTGAGITEYRLFSKARGTLFETPFAHDGLSVSAAKAAWTPDVYYNPQKYGGVVTGTCTCPDTLTVRITSDVSTVNFTVNQLDQTSTGLHANLALTYDAGSGITTTSSRRAVANTAMVPGGTADITVDRALDHTNYDHFTLTATTKGAAVVWRDYALPAWAGPLVAKQSSYPQPFRFSNGSAVTMTSLPMGSVLFSPNHTAPFQQTSYPITVDPAAGTVSFGKPTWITAGGVPDDVQAWVPIYTGSNLAVAPADVAGLPAYDGTCHSVDGSTDTLPVYLPSWRDPADLAGVQAYAADILDSVKDAVCEGVIEILGFETAAFKPGTRWNVDRGDGETDWTGLDLANLQTQVEWEVGAVRGVTSIQCSNRRGHYSAEAFQHPERTGFSLDFGVSGPTAGELGAALAIGVGRPLAGSSGPSVESLGAVTAGQLAAADPVPADLGNSVVGNPNAISDAVRSAAARRDRDQAGDQVGGSGGDS